MGFAHEDEALGRKLHDVIHHTHPDGSEFPAGDCPLYRCARDGTAAHIPDDVFHRTDGRPVPVEYWATPIIRGGVLEGAIWDGEEAFDSVEPGGGGGGEVEHPSRMSLQPGPHLWVFVGGVVVQDGVDQLAGRDVALDGVEEADELLVTVLLHAAPDHRAIQDGGTALLRQPRRLRAEARLGRSDPPLRRRCASPRSLRPSARSRAAWRTTSTTC